MTALKKLKANLEERLEKATEQGEIDELTEQLALVNEAEESSSNLLKSYKELSRKSKTGKTPKTVDETDDDEDDIDEDDDENGNPLSFEEAMQKIIKARKKGE